MKKTCSGQKSDNAARTRTCENMLRKQSYHEFVQLRLSEQRTWLDKHAERGHTSIPAPVPVFFLEHVGVKNSPESRHFDPPRHRSSCVCGDSRPRRRGRRCAASFGARQKGCTWQALGEDPMASVDCNWAAWRGRREGRLEGEHCNCCPRRRGVGSWERSSSAWLCQQQVKKSHGALAHVTYHSLSRHLTDPIALNPHNHSRFLLRTLFLSMFDLCGSNTVKVGSFC